MTTNYSPLSRKLTFLRSLAEDQDRRLAQAWPREKQRHRAWFNTLNEAYVKARYSKHYQISQEGAGLAGRADFETTNMCCRNLSRASGAN